LQRQAYDIAFVFSTKYDPAANPLSRFEWWNRLQVRYFDYHRDLSPELIASMLRGKIVWQRSDGAEWAAIIELDAIRNAKVKSPTLAKAADRYVAPPGAKRNKNPHLPTTADVGTNLQSEIKNLKLLDVLHG
jgi:hypothetical protein